MTDTTIRRMSSEGILDVLFPLASYAFRPSPPFSGEEEWKETVRRREGVSYYALFEGDAGVATVASTEMNQQVRGALFQAGGVWGVVTHPAARRKGYCRRLMAELLAGEHEAGRVLSCLYPFRESFYERLGYVSFPTPRIAKFKPASLAPLLKQDVGGEVTRLRIGDGYDTYRSYLHRLQRRTHGMGFFVYGSKAAAAQNRFWLALAHVDGELAGLLLYELKGEDVGQFTLRATRFDYDNSRAKYLLLQWIARHVDQASEAEIWLPATEQPETWLPDLQVHTESQVRAPMGRVVDVARLGGMRTGPGRFSARIRDPLCLWNEGPWQFETVDGQLEVFPARQAECDLSIQALSALVYGTPDPGDWPFRGWGNPPAALQATLRAVFPPLVPYLHEYF